MTVIKRAMQAQPTLSKSVTFFHFDIESITDI